MVFMLDIFLEPRYARDKSTPRPPPMEGFEGDCSIFVEKSYKQYTNILVRLLTSN